ncbi:hypothetical protein LJR232_004016 [Aquipseudomonas alcaligenes]
MLSKLKWVIQALAIPADEQVRLFPDFVNAADELALILEEVLSDFEGLDATVPVDALLAVRRLDEKILSVSGECNSQVWTERALYESIHWEEIRGLAAIVAEQMGWPIDSPGPAGGIYIGS